MKNNNTKISKKMFYDLGGFANPNLFREADSKGIWSYYLRRQEDDSPES